MKKAANKVDALVTDDEAVKLEAEIANDIIDLKIKGEGLKEKAALLAEATLVDLEYFIDDTLVFFQRAHTCIKYAHKENVYRFENTVSDLIEDIDHYITREVLPKPIYKPLKLYEEV